MSRRDVNLVIKAKDEAKSVLDQITKALEKFADASKGVDSGAEKTESSLGQLGAAIATLNKNLGGLDIADKLGGELRKAEKELRRMEGAFDATDEEAKKLKASLAAAGDQADRYRAKTQGATEALTRQKAALKASKADMKSMSAAYKQAEAAQEKLTARQAKLPAAIAKQSLALKEAKDRYAELSAKIQSTVAPSQTLQNTFASSARSVQTQADKLNKLTTEYGQIGGKIAAAGSAMTLFAGESDKAASKIARQEKSIKQIGEDLTKFSGQSKAASDAQKKLASSFGSINNSLANQSQRIDKARAGYVELATAAGQAEGALKELSQASLGRLEEELRGQRRATLEAKREYIELSAAATKLATDIRSTTAPTAEMTEAFDRTVIKARAAKAEYREQATALELMGRAYRETGTDIASINGTQARFVTILGTTSAALRKNTEAAQQSAAALDKVKAANERAVASQTRFASASERAASASTRGAAATGRMATAYQQFYGESRRSLGLLQRIRGEVLALVAAYGGLYAGIQVLNGTVEAYGKLEAAQARLTVATGGDNDKVIKELDFIRRNADRLGISFGVLSTEYSKFSIATKNTNLEGQATRDIFQSVAEAARVNRSSTQEMAGVFTALTQIVSKGTVQMEELKQQLGDRLPGALQLMADGLKVTTAELTKMLEQGEVTADALIPFAEELDKRFGPGLAKSLESTSAALGQLGQEAFESLLRFGEAGFLDSFTEFAKKLTETLKSADFQTFAGNASKAIGGVVDLLGVLAENFQIVIAAVSAFIGLKITPIFVALTGALKGVATQTTKTGVSMGVLQARAAGMGVNVSRATIAIRGLRIAMVSLLSSTGIGLLVAAIGAGIAYWSSEADLATEAMVEHEKVLDEVKNAYDDVGGSVKKWRDNLEDLTESEAEANLLRIQRAIEEVGQALDAAANDDGSFMTNFFGKNLAAKDISAAYKQAIKNVVEDFRDGKLEAKGFIEQLDEVNQNFSDGSDDSIEYGDSVIKAARSYVELVEAGDKARDMVVALGDDVEAGQEAFDRLGNKIEEAVDPANDFKKAFDNLKGIAGDLADDIPKAAEKTEDAAEAAEKLAEAYEAALQAAGSLPHAIQRAAAEQEALTAFTEGMASALKIAESQIAKDFDQFTDGAEAAAAFIQKKESFIGTAQPDYTYRDGKKVNSGYRVGFGSDTVTDAQGRSSAVTPSTTTTIEAANRDLTRRLTQEFIPAVRAAIGSDKFDSLTPQQQAALTSLAYNYGAGAFDKGALRGVRDAVRDGTKQDVVNAITARIGDNSGINKPRRLEEAALYNTDSGVAFVVAEQNKLIEQQKEFRDELAATNETRRQEAALQNESLIRQEQGKAIREAELKAQELGIELTAEERQKINETVAAKFALKQEEEGIADAKKEAALAEAKVNALLSQRRALDANLKQAQEDGDTEKAAALQEQLAAVNLELTQAIESAKAMWQAIGGEAADNAIIKLETAAIKANTLDLAAKQNGLDWKAVGDVFVNDLASAFDTFAQSVAQGMSIGKAARQAFLKFASDFLIKIGQMIIKQALLNMLKKAFGGGGGIGGKLFGTGHTGGMVGQSRVGGGNSTRRVDPAMFAGAARFHSGGVIGLKPGEVPIIAQRGEEMLTKDDPRHMLNGGGASGPAKAAQRAMTIINTFDPQEAMERALSTPRGEEILVNAVRARRTEVKAALG